MWTKNGSIPQNDTDGTEGWIEVDMPPEVPDGKELVWLNWQWVVRDPKPIDRDGYRWKWNADASQWIEYVLPSFISDTQQIVTISSFDISAIGSQQISAL
jgi:hypothetical protein